MASTSQTFSAVNAPEIAVQLDTTNYETFSIQLDGLRVSSAADSLFMQFSIDHRATWGSGGAYDFTLRKWAHGATSPTVLYGPAGQFVLAMGAGTPGGWASVDGAISLTGMGSTRAKLVDSRMVLFTNAVSFEKHEMDGGILCAAVTDVRIYAPNGTISGKADLLSSTL